MAIKLGAVWLRTHTNTVQEGAHVHTRMTTSWQRSIGNQGGIIRRGDKYLLTYNGDIRENSILCPYMGCGNIRWSDGRKYVMVATYTGTSVSIGGYFY